MYSVEHHLYGDVTAELHLVDEQVSLKFIETLTLGSEAALEFQYTAQEAFAVGINETLVYQLPAADKVLTYLLVFDEAVELASLQLPFFQENLASVKISIAAPQYKAQLTDSSKFLSSHFAYTLEDNEHVLHILKQEAFELRFSSPLQHIAFSLLDNAANTYEYTFKMQNLTRSVTILPELYEHSLVSLRWPDDGAIVSLDVQPMDSRFPVLDFSQIDSYPADWMAESDYIVFRWNLFPDMFLFDFTTIPVMERYLRRLAFYVEKEGYAGTLLDNDGMDALQFNDHELLRRGWNAHDYKADDLADFYNTAIEEDIELYDEEYALRDELEALAVLSRRGNTFFGERGGLLSVAKETVPALRQTFLVHEGFHGVFFASPEFREFCAELYHSFSDEEQWFWKTFLASKKYNVDDEYLVINEVQAYLLQQPLNGVNWYYHSFSIPALKRDYPHLTERLDAFQKENYDSFYSAAVRLNEFLYQHFGLDSGSLSVLQRK